MQWLHASFGVGVTLGPLIMTGALNLFQAWRVGYAVVGAAQLALAVAFGLSAARWKVQPKPGDNAETHLMDYKTPLRDTLRERGAWLSIFLFFVYTGIELTLGHWAYTLLTESRGVAPQAAGLWTGSYWATFTIGRILAGLFTKRIGTHRLVRGSLFGALSGAALLWWNPAPIASLIGVALVGFTIAPIFPGMVSETSLRVGPRFAANTIGMQMSGASLGVASIPGLVGVLAQHFSLEAIPVCLFALFAALLGLYLISMPHKQVGQARPAEHA